MIQFNWNSIIKIPFDKVAIFKTHTHTSYKSIKKDNLLGKLVQAMNKQFKQETKIVKQMKKLSSLVIKEIQKIQNNRTPTHNVHLATIKSAETKKQYQRLIWYKLTEEQFSNI